MMTRVLVALLLAGLALVCTAAQPAGEPAAVYYLLAFNEPLAGHEEEYNRWYDHEHLPFVTSNGGVVNGQRFAAVDVEVVPAQHPPRKYLALYRIETRDLAATFNGFKRNQAPKDQPLDPTSNFTSVYKAMGPEIIGAGPKSYGKGPLKSYLFFVLTTPFAGRDDEFNAWYDRHHAPDVVGTPGFVSAQRLVLSDIQRAPPPPQGGPVPGAERPKPTAKYLAIYKIVTDDLPATFAELDRRAKQGFVMTSAHDGSKSEHFTYEALGPQILHVAASTVTVGSTFKDCLDCPEMVVIPAGSTAMGAVLSEREHAGVLNNASREAPRHTVSIARPFALARAEIPHALYAKFAQATHLSDSPECGGGGVKAEVSGSASGAPVTRTWRNPGFSQTDTEPAVCVSWNDAQAFVSWLSRQSGKHYRLPTEAEWEYAARAGTTTARYWGDDDKSICKKANVMTFATLQAQGEGAAFKDELACNSARRFTTVPGSFDANAFGVYDMLGNVWEAVEDCWHPNYEGAPLDGSAWKEEDCKQRISRGGGYSSPAWLARAATRGVVAPDHRGLDAGLRVARDLE